MPVFPGLLGVVLLVGTAMVLSERRRAISLRVLAVVVLLEYALAGLILEVGWVSAFFELQASAFSRLMAFADEGSAFLFSDDLMGDVLAGSVVDDRGELVAPVRVPWPFVFAVRVLPAIVFFSSLMAALYHLGVMQRVISALARLIVYIPGVSHLEAIAAAANIFVGQTEAPLCIRPYVDQMTRSQLMTMMTTGFATVAGSTIFAYAGLLAGDDAAERQDFIRHLLTASVMSAPAAILMAKLFVPGVAGPGEEARVVRPSLEGEAPSRNLVDALSSGASTGLSLAANIAAALIAFVALIHMLDWPLQSMGTSLRDVLGTSLQPLAWLLGVPWSECKVVGGMLGEKLIATELVAYTTLGDLVATSRISERSAVITTYALCGFANFASIAIQVGALKRIAPSRGGEVSELAPRAMLAGAMGSWLTACVVSAYV